MWLVHGFHNGKITFFSILTHIIPAFWPRKNQQWNSLISTLIFNWAIPEKIQTREFEDILFWKTHWNFSFFYFNTGNSRQNKAKPLDIPQNCVRSLENSKAKNKDPWKFHILGHPWKFHFVFNYPLKIPSAISLIPLDIPYPQPLLRFFSGIAQLLLILHLALFYHLSIKFADQTCYSISRYRELLVKLIFSYLTSS